MEFLLEEISDYLYLFCIIAIVQFLLNLSSSSLHLTIENKVMKLLYYIPFSLEIVRGAIYRGAKREF